MIQAVIFDCFGVLYTRSLLVLQSLCPPERVEELHDVALRSDYGGLTRQEFAEEIGKIVDRSAAEVDDIITGGRNRDIVLVDYVRQVRTRGYKTAMLSNIGPDSIERLFSPGELSELFDVVVMSYKEGIVKPDPQIFERTAERLGVSPDECVMIDDLAENCAGADAAGMRAIQCHDARQTIRDLDELLAQDKAH